MPNTIVTDTLLLPIVFFIVYTGIEVLHSTTNVQHSFENTRVIEGEVCDEVKRFCCTPSTFILKTEVLCLHNLWTECLSTRAYNLHHYANNYVDTLLTILSLV